jgi:RNA polymerase sigma-B factor
VSGRTDLELLSAFRAGGDGAARDELVERHLPLVEALGRRYANRGEPLDDLVQVGCIGLINAIDRFDAGHGASLTTYAVPYVVGEIKRYFRDKGWAVRPPRRLQELSLRLGGIVDSLALELGRSPSLSEIADRAGVDEEELLEAMESAAGYRAQSLFAPVEGSEGATDLSATIGVPDDGFEAFEDRALIAQGLSALDEREREIVRLRFFGELTQSQIAERVGISQMHVSRLLRGAVAKMQESVEQAAMDAGGGRA